MTVGVLSSLCAALLAVESGKPSVVALPLSVDPQPSLLKLEVALQIETHQLFDTNSGALIASLAEARAAASAVGDVRADDAALGRAALNAGTLYAVYAELQYSAATRALTFVARVVRNDGVAMSSVRETEPKNELPLVSRARVLLERGVMRLRLGELPVVKSVAPVTQTPPVLVPDPAPTPPPVVVATEPERSRLGAHLSRGPFIAGGGVALVGAALLAVAAVLGNQLGVEEGLLPEMKAEDFRTARGLSIAGFSTLGVGIVTAVVGLFIWLLGEPTS
jgi:hypothetical protein